MGEHGPSKPTFLASETWAAQPKTAEFEEVALAVERLAIDPAKNGNPQDVKLSSYM